MHKYIAPVIFLALAPGTAFGQSDEEKPATLELSIEGMNSDQCAKRISEMLDELEGVRRADISFSRRGGAMEYNAARTDPSRIMEAVRSSIKHMSGKGAYDAKRNLPSVRVSLFDVALECAAAPEIGCGPVAKPLLSALEAQAGVSEAWLNRAGTTLAIVWAEDANPERRESAMHLLLSKGVNDATRKATPREVVGPQREARLDEFLRLTGVWYRDTAIRALFEYEAEVIAKRLVRRVQAQVALDDATARAVVQALIAVAQAHMTQDLEALKEWARTGMNDDLINAARPHLDDKGVAAMRKALEAGFRPLPDEVGGDRAAAPPCQLNPWEPIDATFRGCEGA